MVKVQNAVPLDQDGRVDIEQWVDALSSAHDEIESEQVLNVALWLDSNHPQILMPGVELATLTADLNMDTEAVLAGLLYRGLRRDAYATEDLTGIVSQDVLRIAEDVLGMAGASLLDMSNSAWLEKERQDQVENVRRMLVSLVKDVRVAVVKLAERLFALRSAKHYSEKRRLRIAQEAQAVFAPLAGRLGIWQVKWELEDLSLRYTHPDEYQSIAKQLQAKRVVRESQVELMVDQVRALLRSQGIDAQVFGRAKNIYSIWRKMRRKNVSFSEVYDVRAVRVVVGRLADCYAALGVIHSTWEHLPSEFDDYVANPKENGYQSIHTAVTADDGGPLEIQIRTDEMHQDAELGVCAHWNYKGDGDHDTRYAQKMEWLRQVLEWHDELAGTQSISDILRQGVSDERIYVSTPKGHVLDLPEGSTVLDFAYRVHTDVGHACHGARVNGEPAPLNRELNTAEQVEVIPGERNPDRRWLEQDFGYVRTDRARAKLTSYFRELSDLDKHTAGRNAMGRLCAMFSIVPDDTALERFGCASIDELLTRVGGGEVSMVELLDFYLREAAVGELPGLPTAQFPQVLRFRLSGDNRDGLLHELTDLIGRLELDLSGTTGRVSEQTGRAILTVDVSVPDWRAAVVFASSADMLEGVDEVERLSV